MDRKNSSTIVHVINLVIIVLLLLFLPQRRTGDRSGTEEMVGPNREARTVAKPTVQVRSRRLESAAPSSMTAKTRPFSDSGFLIDRGAYAAPPRIRRPHRAEEKLAYSRSQAPVPLLYPPPREKAIAMAPTVHRLPWIFDLPDSSKKRVRPWTAGPARRAPLTAGEEKVLFYRPTINVTPLLRPVGPALP